MNDGETFNLLSNLQGCVVQQIRRIRYVVRGEITSDMGPIEIVFTDGSVVLLDAGSDGESLDAKSTAWVDHFAEPLSAENKRFVEESGKWTAFDVSAQQPYSRLISQRIVEVVPVRTLEDKIKGAMIRTARGVTQVEVDADEVSVNVA